VPGLYRIFVQFPVWVRHFPFFELATTGKFGAETWPPGTDYVEPIAGILVTSPLCIAGLLLPVFLWRFRARIPAAVVYLLLSTYVAAVTSMFTIVMVVHRIAQRYLLDFAPALLILSFYVLLYLVAHVQTVRYRQALDAATVLGAATGIFIQ